MAMKVLSSHHGFELSYLDRVRWRTVLSLNLGRASPSRADHSPLQLECSRQAKGVVNSQWGGYCDLLRLGCRVEQRTWLAESGPDMTMAC